MKFQEERHIPQLRPLTKSSEHIASFFAQFRKPVAILIFILVFEAWIGHPALRMTWTGSSSDPSSAFYCEVVTLPFLEKQTFYEYKSLITVVEPKVTIREWAIQKVKALLQ